MEKRKLSKSKMTGKLPSGDGELAFSIIVNVRDPHYVPSWLPLRKRITSHIFTTDIKQVDFPRLEADDQVISYAFNEKLDPLD